MLTTKTVTKNILETIVHETFSKFGAISSSNKEDEEMAPNLENVS